MICRQKCASAPVCALTVSSKMQDLSPKVRKCSSLCTYGEHVEIFKIFKNEKCAHRRCTDWSMCEKKCDTWAKALGGNLTLTSSIATMLILMSAACIIITTTKFSAPDGLWNPDFPSPVLLVYETHNEGRLGKKSLIFVSCAPCPGHGFGA